MRLFSLVSSIVSAALIALGCWIWFDRPVAVPENWDKPLASVSFAPFHRFQSPLTETFPTPEQIRTDLVSLKGHAGGVRTYTALENMEVVPGIARELGLQMTAGAWLGSPKEPKPRLKNEREIEALIEAANAYPDVITRVLVGNEVLLRNDLPPDELIKYIRRVKAAIKQPVSYADVWAFYLKYPQVVAELDYLTIHILPFWEDEPVALANVEPYVIAVVERIRKAFPGKPILIGEIGWPSLGRDRGPADVNLINQARFLRRIARVAAENKFDYNVVEAFDQPWKAALENTVGAYWGVLDSERRPKFEMSGPVTAVPDWKLRAILAIVAGALAAFAFGRRIESFFGGLTVALLAQFCSALAVITFFHTAATSLQWWNYPWEAIRAGMPILLGLVIVARAAHWLAGSESEDSRGEILAAFFAVYAMIWTILLTWDGRYRDIPVFDFALPCAGIAALILVRAVLAIRDRKLLLQAFSFDGLFGSSLDNFVTKFRTKLFPALGWGLVLAAILACVGDGLAVIGEDFVRDHPTFASQLPPILEGMIWNRQMNLWAAMQLVMAVPFLAFSLAKRRAAK